MNTKIISQKTTPLELKSWTHPMTGEIRWYVQNILDFAGLEVEINQKLGRISIAFLNGQRISTLEAARIIRAINSPIWISSDKKTVNFWNASSPRDESYVTDITDAIRSEVLTNWAGCVRM